MHFLSGMHFTATFTSSKKYLGCPPLPFSLELVSGEIIRPVMDAEHVQCHKHDMILHATPIF